MIEVMRMTSLVTPFWVAKRDALSAACFPTDNDRRRRWISAINRKDWRPTQYIQLCLFRPFRQRQEER